MKRVVNSKKYQYTFSDGTVVTSMLSGEEMVRRMNRLDTLRVLTEENDCPEGRSISRKALAAWNKNDNFTGIIRLTSSEKDWLSYKLESNMLDDNDRECIKFYCRMPD